MTQINTLTTTLDMPNAALTQAVAVHLPSTYLEKVPAVVNGLNIEHVTGPQIISFGQAPINEFSRHLDDMLAQITKADAPVLFELFRQISKGVKNMDLPVLELQIREKLKGTWFSRLTRTIGLSQPADYLEKVTDEVRALLKSKASSLLDLIRPMELQISAETTKLIAEINRLNQQAEGYRDSILNLGVYVVAGHQTLHATKQQLLEVEHAAQTSQDPMQIRAAKDFRIKVELFENRVLTLEQTYAKAPVDLESIGIAQHAGLMTLADTVSSSQVEFNDIKSALLRLNATFQIKSLQQLNSMRRELRADLQKYTLQQLETVAIDATRSAADAQLDQAQLLLGVAKTLEQISSKVDAERENNKIKINTTRELLKQVQQSMATL